MISNVEKAVIKTLIYADVFSYPLTKEEIRKWLIDFRVRPAKDGKKFRINKNKLIKEEEGFYFLKERRNIINLRKQREKWSKEKINIAEEIALFLKSIPTVKLVGITGGLSIGNAKKEDDIDLFVITSSESLWVTRFLVTLLIEILGKRRHPADTEVDNKICLNMFIDERHLTVPKKEQDLFSAHEVLQMKPLWHRDDTYQKFLQANNWVKRYLPNTVKNQSRHGGTKVKNTHSTSLGQAYKKSNIFHSFLIFICHFAFGETILKKIQLWYMRKRRTTEVIGDGIIRFHPQDVRVWVLREYKRRLSRITP